MISSDWFSVTGRDFSRRDSFIVNKLDETMFFPEVSDLPAGLSESEFLATYGGVDNPLYDNMISEINKRVLALPFYRSVHRAKKESLSLMAIGLSTDE